MVNRGGATVESGAMARLPNSGGSNRTLALLAAAAIIAALYLARDVLIPLSLSVLLSFLLVPLVTRLERLGLGRIPAVLGVVFFGFALIGLMGWLVVSSLIDLGNELPGYRDDIRRKIAEVRGSTGGVQKIQQFVEDVTSTTEPTTAASTQSVTRPATSGEIAPTTSAAAALAPIKAASAVESSSAPPATQPGLRRNNPLWVAQAESQAGPIELLQNTVGRLLSPLGTAAIVLIFVIFMLLEKDELRDRFIRLVNQDDMTITTQAMDDAAQRVSRYLLMQLLVNGSYGLVIGLGLLALGVPNALLWGLLCALFRFVPYIGPWIAAAFPIILSIAVFPGWREAIYVVLLFVIVEIISNNVMEPWLYGSSTGMSAMAVLTAAVFWTWLWGPIGLLLSTPLTVCVVVLGKYVPSMKFLDILLGDSPVLSPEMRIYQRLLAQDPEEAMDVLEEALPGKPLVELYDQALIPAMMLAEQDRHRGRLDEVRWKFIRQGFHDMVEELGEAARPDDAPPAEQSTGAFVLILPARDQADEIVAVMLSQVLRQAGCAVESLSIDSLASEMVAAVESRRPRVVCISALPPSAIIHARYLCKRLKTHLLDPVGDPSSDNVDAAAKELRGRAAMLVIGLWNSRSDLTKARRRLLCREHDVIVTTLGEMLRHVQPMLGGARKG